VAFYFVNDGTVDVACAFDEDASQLTGAFWRHQTALHANHISTGSRVNIHLGAEAQPSHGQNCSVCVDFILPAYNWQDANTSYGIIPETAPTVCVPAFQPTAFQFDAFQTCEEAPEVCVPAFQPNAFQFNAFQTCEEAPEETQTRPVGGAWIEPRQAEKARRKAEREKREAWRRLEEDIEEAYAKATGKPRKQIKPVVREALAARDPESVKRIAEQLSVSTDPAAVALTQRIDARVSEIEQLVLLIAEVEQAMAFARMRDEDEAIALLLMAN
jgi:hypothetical protein